MFGITLCTSSDASRFWRLVDMASTFESEPSIPALGYPPHLTLARYPEIATHLLLDAVREFRGEKPFPITFDRISIFEVDPVVLWLSPRREPRLLGIQARIHDLISVDLCDPYYRPKQWTPHMTLAMAIDRKRRKEALEFAARSIEPFELLFDRVDCVSAPPVQVLHTQTL